MNDSLSSEIACRLSEASVINNKFSVLVSLCSSTLTFHTSKELSNKIITQRSYTNGGREKRAVFRGNSRVQPPQLGAVHLMRGGKHPRVFSRVTKWFISWSTLPASSNNFLFSHMASLSTHMQRYLTAPASLPTSRHSWAPLSNNFDRPNKSAGWEKSDECGN